MIYKTKKKIIQDISTNLRQLTYDARALAIYMLQSEQYTKDIELQRLVINILRETKSE